MVVEVADSGISWTEPKDLSLESLGAVNGESPALTVSSRHFPREEFFFIYDRDPLVCVAMADGSVNVLRTGGLRPRTCGRHYKLAAQGENSMSDDRPLPAR